MEARARLLRDGAVVGHGAGGELLAEFLQGGPGEELFAAELGAGPSRGTGGGSRPRCGRGTEPHPGEQVVRVRREPGEIAVRLEEALLHQVGRPALGPQVRIELVVGDHQQVRPAAFQGPAECALVAAVRRRDQRLGRPAPFPIGAHGQGAPLIPCAWPRAKPDATIRPVVRVVAFRRQRVP